jgi:hypothetical protein
MPEALEAAGQYMQQEAADTFVGVECHGLATIALTTVAVGKADPSISHVEEPVVRDGDAMRIAADIVQDVCRAGKGRLGIDDPLCGIELIAKLCKALRDSQSWGALSEGQGTGGACLGQRREEAQGPHRNRRGSSIQRSRWRKRASRHEAVDMAMRPKVWSHVQDHGAPDLSAEVAVPKLHEG